jgi:hypothetical protein
MPKLQEIVSVPEGPTSLQHGVASPEGATVSDDSAAADLKFRLSTPASWGAPAQFSSSPPLKQKGWAPVPGL